MIASRLKQLTYQVLLVHVKKKFPGQSGTDVEKGRSQTREIIYKASSLELPFSVLIYFLGNIHTTIKFG